MGRKRKDGMELHSDEAEDLQMELGEDAATVAVEDAPAPLPTVAGPRKFMVRLNCPTPLLYKSLEVAADSDDEAKQKFCEANGISGSVHPWDIKEVS